MTSPVMHSKVNVQYGEIESVRAGVDWVSCSLPDDAVDRWGWTNEGAQMVAEVADDGHQVGPLGVNGYKGIMAGGCFVGRRDDGSYIQLAGAYAQKFYRKLNHPALSVSRLDLAVTVQFRTMPKSLGQEAYAAAEKAVENLPSSRRRRIWCMSGTDGGYTLYIGAPTSSQRGRLYNKEVQSDVPEYARCWRYEVVFRNTLADQQYDSLLAVHEVYAPLMCSAVVKEWYGIRGVVVPISSETGGEVLPIEKKAPSDAAKKLLWLEKQVRPSLRWLFEEGYRNEALNALGIDE